MFPVQQADQTLQFRGGRDRSAIFSGHEDPTWNDFMFRVSWVIENIWSDTDPDFDNIMPISNMRCEY